MAQSVKNGISETYATYDYKAVNAFTPLSETNWFHVTQLTNVKASPDGYSVMIDVRATPVDGNGSPIDNLKMLIDVTSCDNDSLRVRFTPFAKDFIDYQPNTFGPVTQMQLDWLKKQDRTKPIVDMTGNVITLRLKQVTMQVQKSPFNLRVTRNSDGLVLHEDGWIMKPGSPNMTRGLVFLNPQMGAAIAALKTKPRHAKYYGCGESYDYRPVDDYKTSDLGRNRQMLTYFNYDDYGYGEGELDPNDPDEGGRDYYYPMYGTFPCALEQTDAYAYALFQDNTSQTYFNFSDSAFPSNGTQNTGGSNFQNVFFFGSQYGGLDYHLVFSDFSSTTKGYLASVLDRFSVLMGQEYKNDQALNLRGVMPPKYLFGYFQGVYGLDGLINPGTPSPINEPMQESPLYVSDLVANYREAMIPLEGLAIDIDVQDELAVFTTSGAFWTGGQVGSGKSVFDWAHEKDLVCHTNITCFVKDNLEVDHLAYPVYSSMLKEKAYSQRQFNTPDATQLYNQSIQRTDPSKLGDAPGDSYIGYLWYGSEQQSTTALFPDFGKPTTRKWWGANYWGNGLSYPLLGIGLDFVWQDMTEPSMAPHVLGDPVVQIPPSYDYMQNLTNNKFNWKSYHGQLLITDPRFSAAGDPRPFIALRNFHAYMECKATYENGLVANPNIAKMKFQRSYIISRGGYIGLQHYGGMWTGDNESQWQYMQYMIPMVLNMGLTQLPVVGADIGGFGQGNGCAPPDNYMMSRWVQAGCLLPWFRNHYARQNTPKGIGGKYFQELYAYGDMLSVPMVDKSNQVADRSVPYSRVMGEYVKLRVRWHHLLYDGMYKFVTSGLPVVKPTCLYDGGGGTGADLAGAETKQNDQFFIGNYDVAVAPAVLAGMFNSQGEYLHFPVWLPTGRKWFPYDAINDCAADGNLRPTPGSFGYVEGSSTPYPFDVEIFRLPLFIRDGAILPTRITADGSVKNVQQLTDADPFVIDLWPGNANSYDLYLDDGGKTRDAETRNNYAVFRIQNASAANAWNVGLSCVKGDRAVAFPFYLRMRASNAPSGITDSSGSTFAAVSSRADLFKSGSTGYFYDGARKELWIKTPKTWGKTPYNVSVKYASDAYQLNRISK